MLAMASPTSQRWLASIISLRSPISSRMMAARRMSSSMIGAHLDLEVGPSGCDGFAAELAQLVVGESEPAGGGGVGGIAAGAHFGYRARRGPGVCARRISSASAGVSASVM